MTKRGQLPQQRRHILVFDEDWDFLMQEYGPQSANPIGVSKAIRAIIHKKVLGLKHLANAKFDEIRANSQRGVLEEQDD